MKTLIFSDVHLKVPPAGRDVYTVFLRFLRQVDPQTVSRLVILGDLFDFWFEYRHVIFSGYFDVLRRFADFHDAGMEVHFVCGNHDLWAGRFLERQLGFIIHPDRLRLRFGDLDVLMLHGDGINPRDVGYRIYKRFATFPIVVGAFRLLHPDWAMKLAGWVSHGSRRLLEAEDLSQGPEVEPLRRFAREVIERGEADAVICGHSHFPVMETFPSPKGFGTYINTGDWLYHRSYVEWFEKAFHLRSFESTVERGEVTRSETGDAIEHREQEPQ
ncbi:MAG TPA: UDP-2,3-diacylglucosamine diphosphatase [Candidatus Hydrogenedentes bacterium]|nr:UDP-2,3-diacylglucosamine diphosphatase [Candidatus Hydrogenedentota bacterium]HOL77646.1 UDP-2,3-diacylglucosamine diphosphatase [Candidatus Hydrogenedentota bacterium]HPO87372.1 UDP-2,3-diacylglucosamine diphosphatase [Candidatus Hydrogenedentota bacterium]